MKITNRRIAFLTAVWLGVLAAFSFVPEAQAKETVYVLVQTKTGGAGVNYDYNKKGLMTTKARFGDSDENIAFKYDAKTNRLTDRIVRTGREEASYHYDYNKKGQRTQSVSNLYGSTTVAYTYDKKKRLAQETWVVNGIQNWMIASYTYNEKSLISAYGEKYIDGYADNLQMLTYDKKGNLKKVEYGNGTITFTNTYKGGRLVKRQDGAGVVTTFKYKKISVDSKLADRIEAQQWRAINDLVPGTIE